MSGEDWYFGEFVMAAAGFPPYRYQQRLADEGPPQVLEVPTGAGKTLAAVLPWLYRRRFHPDRNVRRGTPRRLVLVLPMRVLVEQTLDAVRGWLDAMGEDREGRFDVSDVQIEVVMGGEPRRDDDWRLQPHADTVLVGTLDMLLSRALNRGYAQSRWAWPIDFGLLNTDCHWVLDEVQLMGPALPTSRQLQAFRDRLGTAAACTSTWMSATVDPAALQTVDNPHAGGVQQVTAEDRQGALRVRLEAPKRVEELHLRGKDRERQLAENLLARHRPGTLTLAMLNSVQRAQALHAALVQRAPDAPVVLLHSRFRPADRRRQVDQALAPAEGPGRIVVSTQVLEAGVDVSAETLLTEAASWASVVQRAGRCNRDGRAVGATLLWLPPPKPEPYDPRDVGESVAALRRLEGATVTPLSLPLEPVEQQRVDHPVLRHRDLVELFDTAPDLSGDDIDISRFLRDADEIDVHVAWRGSPSGGNRTVMPVPTSSELCPVPVGQFAGWLQLRGITAWRLDHHEDQWVRVSRRQDLRPGHVLIVDADAGGYTQDRGWDPASRTAVAVLDPEEPSLLAAAEEPVQDDEIAYSPRRWVPLVEHLADVEREVRELGPQLGLHTGVGPAHLEAAAVAGRLHDVGKAHRVFQDTLERSAADEDQRPDVPRPWAKSGGTGRPRHSRSGFRHELVSALALLGSGAGLLDGVEEPDLVRYLVAAHHGRVRLAIRSLPGKDRDPDDPDRRVALGVHDGEAFGPVEVPGGVVPAGVLDLSVMDLGVAADGCPSWTGRALALRDRPDLGLFRLGMLEALVRLADWRASR